MYVAICRECSKVLVSRSEASLLRDMVLHYSVHVCGHALRAVCVSEAFKKYNGGGDVKKFFDVWVVRGEG